MFTSLRREIVFLWIAENMDELGLIALMRPLGIKMINEKFLDLVV